MDICYLCLHCLSWSLWVNVLNIFSHSVKTELKVTFMLRLTWLLKEWLYRDRSWESPCTLGSAIFQFMGMGVGFWSSIVLLTTSEVSYSHYLLVSIDDVVS